MSTPPDPGQQPAPQQPTGTVRLHVQGSVLTRTITPTVQVNGYPVPASFGVNDIPVYAGPTHLHVQTPWMRAYGQADLALQVAPGSLSEVWYAAPWHQFTTGSIGLEKQRSKGAWVLFGLLGLLVLVVVLAVLAGLLGS